MIVTVDTIDLLWISVLISSSITFFFPPIQWLKNKLRIGERDLFTAMDMREGKTSLGEKSHYYICKLMNCSLCMGFWVGTILIIPFIELELVFLITGFQFALSSSIVTEILYRILNE